MGFEQRYQQEQQEDYLPKIVAYGCQTPSAQRRSDQFPLALVGVLAPVSAHAGPSTQTPIDTSGNWSERRCADSVVAIKLGIIFSLLLSPPRRLLKTPEGVIVGFQIFAWAPN